MKKIKKFLIFIILSFILVPISSNALTKETDYININDRVDINFDSITIKNAHFENPNNLKDLIAEIYIEENTTHYELLISYFDESFKYLGNSGNYNINNSDNNIRLSQLFYGIDKNQVKYFKLKINSIIDNNSTTNNQQYQTNILNDYYISSYDINIIVNENNTFDITENITAYFNVPKHGIFRTIPLKNEITRLDGTTHKNRVQISNVKVNNEYTTSRESGNLKLQIGSPSRTLTGEQTYEIKYNYNLGKDPLKDIDEFYFNIIGNEWDTVINNITFTITMPKEFDSKKIGFSSGITGSTDSSKVKYTVNGNTIKGSYNGILNENEALTVRCELEEGYFVGAGFERSPYISFMFIIPILGLVISFILWYKYGRDEKVVETVEFYPPEGFNSLEVGFLYKGKATNQDVVSLLIYLANKGYIKIAETEEKILFSKIKGFKITKLKEYDGNNINEQIFLNGLFKGKKNFVTSIDLYDEFYKTIELILHNINHDKGNKDKIFKNNVTKKSVLTLGLAIFSLFVIITIPTMDYGGLTDLISTIFVFLFCLLFMIFGIFQIKSIGYKILCCGISLLFGLGFSSELPIGYAIVTDSIYMIGIIIGFICFIGMIICFVYMPNRTPYGNEMLGKLKGFKNFLETAEKDKLETLVMKDPEYFYNILPFTYVLGVSDKWIKKFESITLQSPDWYDGPDIFDMVVFSSFMHNTMSSAKSSMTSSPSSSSGGGSSGGGSGGGGGGSW